MARGAGCVLPYLFYYSACRYVIYRSLLWRPRRTLLWTDHGKKRGPVAERDRAWCGASTIRFRGEERGGIPRGWTERR